MIDPKEFAGRVAIITGAGQGMGRSVAERLAAGGATVVVNDINPDTIEKVASAIRSSGAESIAVVGNVTSGADVKRMVDTTVKKYGGVHILINNAGILRPTRIIDIEEDEWELVINVNLKGTYLCSRAVLPYMRKAQWGRIVNFSSTAGKSVSTIGGAHYTAAKAAILGFSRALAKEEAKNGITSNSVCPGLIDTEMVRGTIDAAKVKAYEASFPIPRLGLPSEVAELVAFLASDRAAYITGASLDINGGDLMI